LLQLGFYQHCFQALQVHFECRLLGHLALKTLSLFISFSISLSF